MKEEVLKVYHLC